MITFDTLIQDVNNLVDGDYSIDQAVEIGRRLEALEISIDNAKGATVEEMTKMGDVFVALLALCKQRGYQADTCLNLSVNRMKCAANKIKKDEEYQG